MNNLPFAGFCRFVNKGGCKKGANCPRSHANEGVLCRDIEVGCTNENCTFVHEKNEKNVDAVKVQKKPCLFINNGKGGCKFGLMCSFSHELSGVICPDNCSSKTCVLLHRFGYKVRCPNGKKCTNASCNRIHARKACRDFDTPTGCKNPLCPFYHPGTQGEMCTQDNADYYDQQDWSAGLIKILSKK
jgi:RNA-binding, Nab2-type zinc finger